jgi:hypothetical protein
MFVKDIVVVSAIGGFNGIAFRPNSHVSRTPDPRTSTSDTSSASTVSNPQQRRPVIVRDESRWQAAARQAVPVCVQGCLPATWIQAPRSQATGRIGRPAAGRRTAARASMRRLLTPRPCRMIDTTSSLKCLRPRCSTMALMTCERADPEIVGGLDVRITEHRWRLRDGADVRSNRTRPVLRGQDNEQGPRVRPYAFASVYRMVGARRFELPTPCTPCRCATRLRYAPTPTSNYSCFIVPDLAVAVFPPASAAIRRRRA